MVEIRENQNDMTPSETRKQMHPCFKGQTQQIIKSNKTTDRKTSPILTAISSLYTTTPMSNGLWEKNEIFEEMINNGSSKSQLAHLPTTAQRQTPQTNDL